MTRYIMDDGAIDFYPPCRLLTVHCNKQLSAGTLGVELCSSHSCRGSCSEYWQAGADSVHMHPGLIPRPHASEVSCPDHMHVSPVPIPCSLIATSILCNYMYGAKFEGPKL